MKRLFQINNIKTNKPIDGVMGSVHENKQSAKGMRDAFNALAGEIVYKVSPGPDHRNYKG